jgi:16S rRNA (uracil1498-N3)-methyltransferase
VRRVFVPSESAQGDRLVLRGDEAHYLVRVLRLGPGDRFGAVLTTGEERVATVHVVRGGEVEATLSDQVVTEGEPRVDVRLLVGLPKPAKLELIIQKCTELGVSAIRPLICRRSVPRPASGAAGHRLARWQRIAQEAARQCGRTTAPVMDAPEPLAAALASVAGSGGVSLVFSLDDAPTGDGARSLLGADWREPVTLLIGPEGGFAPEEVTEAVAAGFRPAALGRRVLRAETAAIVTCAIVMRELGELG